MEYLKNNTYIENHYDYLLDLKYRESSKESLDKLKNKLTNISIDKDILKVK